jgi:hypothetical protein
MLTEGLPLRSQRSESAARAAFLVLLALLATGMESVQDSMGRPFHVFRGTRFLKQGPTSIDENTSIGSIFYIRLTQEGWNTRVEMLGKPTHNRRVACSDEDAAWGLSCDGVESEPSGSGREKMTGSEEAFVIRTLLRIMKSWHAAADGS